MSFKKVKLAKGVQGCFIESKHLNTTLISYNFYLPLNSEDMAGMALLPYLLTSCSKAYPEFTGLNIRLLELYGADLSCRVSKSGDYLHIRISISVINDELSFDALRPVDEAAKLISGLIFEPSLSVDSFKTEDVAREVRKTIERIEGEINDKRSFARTRMLSAMFGSDPYGKFIYGTKEEVEKITGKDLYDLWLKLLQTAFVRINVVGKELPQGIFEDAGERFASLDRSNVTKKDIFVGLNNADEAKDLTERYEVTQGKIVMGFSSKLHGGLDKTAALLVLTDIFGGGPYSKLFENVREKQSLCYYCSASSRRNKGFVTVDSGIEEKNADKLISAVLSELEDIQNGKFDDSLIEASKKALNDSLISCYDSATVLDGWYGREIGDAISPEAALEIVCAVTREDIINAAKGLKLHTVYRLLPKGGAGQ